MPCWCTDDIIFCCGQPDETTYDEGRVNIFEKEWSVSPISGRAADPGKSKWAQRVRLIKPGQGNITLSQTKTFIRHNQTIRPAAGHC